MSAPYAVKTARVAWDEFRAAAIELGPSEAEGVARLALGAWSESDAGTKVGASRDMREALVASVLGASSIEHAITKLASEGRIGVAEAEYMRELNAEAAMADLGRLTKSAGALGRVLSVLRKNPALVGIGLGGMAGATFGAASDKEDRLRGAVRFGVPGAVAGGLLGQGVTDYRAEQARQALKDSREAELHDLALRKARQR